MREESAATMPARFAGPTLPTATQGAGDPQGARSGRRNAYAALDLGTNNCRLLVAEPASN